uniref:EF hand family protein n=1 Tax=Solanum tuberosum TaxID=4113 RepID=M1DBV1_SOLTU
MNAEELRRMFQIFDKNDDGHITMNELNDSLENMGIFIPDLLGSLGLKQGGNVEDCRKMINNVDVDGDGRIDFMEFKKMMMRGVGFASFT